MYFNMLVTLFVLKYALNQIDKDNITRRNNLYLFISSVLLCAMTGLRGLRVGRDTVSYQIFFKIIGDHNNPFENLGGAVDRFEFGFKLFGWIIAKFTDSYNVFLIVCAACFSICVYILIKRNSKNYFISIILYYTVGVFSFQLTGIRQSLALGILMVSFEFIKEKKFWKFLLCVIVASYFHKSALTFLPMYFFAYMDMNFKTFIFIFIFGSFSIVYNKLVTLFANKLLGYEYGLGSPEGGEFVILMHLAAIVIAMIFRKQLLEQNEKNKLFFNATVISLIIYVLRYFVQAAERISFYYQFALVILLANVLEAIPDKATRTFVTTCAVVLASMLFLYRTTNGSMPIYYFFWQ